MKVSVIGEFISEHFTIAWPHYTFASLAGSIYLKNLIISSWEVRERENLNDPIPFCIHEMDKAVLRQNVVNAVIASPLPIRCAMLAI